MSSADDRQLARFVAGLPADDRALANAIAARALDRAIVVDVLLDTLAGPIAATRLTAARRVARMSGVAPRVAARLRIMALADDDDRVRAACRAALAAHGLALLG